MARQHSEGGQYFYYIESCMSTTTYCTYLSINFEQIVHFISMEVVGAGRQHMFLLVHVRQILLLAWTQNEERLSQNFTHDKINRNPKPISLSEKQYKICHLFNVLYIKL